MKFIDPKLQQQDDFVEVRETFKRIRQVQAGTGKESSLNNKTPETFALVKKIAENRRPDQFAVTEHVKNLASLQRRIEGINNAQMRKKNINDPIVYPARFRRPGYTPKSANLSGLSKRLAKLSNNQKSQIKSI